MRRKSGKKYKLNRILALLLLVVVLIFVLYPFYSMILSSFKTTRELYNIHSNPLWVSKPTLENYLHLFTKTNYLRWYLNSALVAAVTTTVSIFSSVLAAYALSRLRFRGAKTMGTGIFVVYLIPQTLLFI
ncbi:MAG: multiple sugar transport system permease protein, partial [Candidatus Atribacteria bacterium]|nr:multiple sugar transport system permease protein [Candidatus Atribacteria bacterium]